MKLVSHYFESISGIEIYPIISFLIFFTFFIVVTFMAFKMDKDHVKDLSNMPLENETEKEENSVSEMNL